MEINFEFKNGVYESVFKTESDFNIHLEREEASPLMILQKTSGDNYAKTMYKTDAEVVYDYDFGGYVYPKDIKVISYSKVVKGYVTKA